MSKIEELVCKKILNRADIGLDKYAVTMERDDLSLIEWIEHAQQEAMDLVVYLEKILTMIRGE